MSLPNSNHDTNWTAFPVHFHLFILMAFKDCTSLKMPPWRGRHVRHDWEQIVLVIEWSTSKTLYLWVKMKMNKITVIQLSNKRLQLFFVNKKHPYCICAPVFPGSFMVLHRVVWVITRPQPDWFSRCEGPRSCGWDKTRTRTRGSPVYSRSCPSVPGWLVLSRSVPSLALEASVQHLWTECHPTCS